MAQPRLIEDNERTREICARHGVPLALLEKLLELELHYDRAYQKRRGLHEEVRRMLDEAAHNQEDLWS